MGEKHIPAIDADVAHMAAFLAKLTQLVKDGLVRPLPIKLWEGGFAAVPDGLQYMRWTNHKRMWWDARLTPAQPLYVFYAVIDCL